MVYQNQRCPLGITIFGILMILFGLSEVVTGFRHNFLGLISTTDVVLATYGAAGVGVLYAIGGMLLLTHAVEPAMKVTAASFRFCHLLLFDRIDVWPKM
jgi:hypothetical protein